LKYLLAAILAAAATAQAHAASLSDLAFLEGDWVSDRSGFVIEENWSDAKAGVVLGMSRGAQNDMVRFLRFAVVEQVGDEVFMRFKRYNPDYSSWETGGPSVMRLVRADRQQVVFEATDAASDVQRITYHIRANGVIDVVANRTDEKGPYLVEFTLRRPG
jgi:Domain of unknown function (DUF6265)